MYISNSSGMLFLSILLSRKLVIEHIHATKYVTGWVNMTIWCLQRRAVVREANSPLLSLSQQLCAWPLLLLFSVVAYPKERDGRQLNVSTY